MSGTGCIVQNHPGNAHIRLKVHAPLEHSRCGASHFGAVNNEHNRGIKEAGQMGSGTAPIQIFPVEQTAIAFNQGHIELAHSLSEK
jgi:hypothetical protein